jgi:PEGA domain
MSDEQKKPPPKPDVIDPNVDGEWKAPTRGLDAEGRMVGLKQPPARTMSNPNAQVQPEDPSGLPRLSALTTGDLELARDPSQRPGQVYEEQVYRDEAGPRSRKKAIIAVVALVALAVGGFAFLYASPRLQATVNAHTPKGPLVVSSDPSGAELWLAGNKVGTTPWAADNRFVGKTTYEVRMKGFKAKKGTFLGGGEVHLDVALEPE